MTTLSPTESLPSTRSTGPLGDLARFGDTPALVFAGTCLSYADLAGLVDARAAALGTSRRLVMLECHNDVETVVSYLAALQGQHPVLLVGQDCLRDDLVATYRPQVVVSGSRLDVLDHPTHDLHPDLALMLSTSGSTGSPKLVRLSRENLRSNAESIATYLGLRADDRAATTLPMHYCYGLSVVNSHLLVGASLLLTGASVIEEQFWQEFAHAGATSFAAVPHIFDLLDSCGFEDRDLPTLRTVTQAGGRLDPIKVRRYSLLGRARGFDLVVMYGQTEATARMAYLPPDLAVQRPECIGIPVPGGSLRIDGEREVGELIYSGENVMLGYARGREDLALGRTVHELRTGDLARQHEDGMFELVGRASRFAKLFGNRVDLDRVEDLAAQDGISALALEHDGGLHLFVTRASHVEPARALADRLGLPDHSVVVHVLVQQPLTANGKIDYAALVRHAEAATASLDPDTTGTVTPRKVRDLYAHLLGRPDATEDDSFVALRGDSLSYVEASVRMAQLLGDIPQDWAHLSARQLAAAARTSGSDPARCAPVETSVILRAVAIVVIVASHANVMTLMGGAHVLLAVVGFNLVRFQLAGRRRSERRRSFLRAGAVVAVPSALWISVAGALTGSYDASTALMLNFLLGSDTWDERWQFWFLEALVWTMVAASLLVSVPAADRLERRQPFAVAAGLFLTTLGVRYVLVGFEAGSTDRYALPAVLWCVALGWMAARSATRRQRTLTSLAAGLACWGYFDDPVREGLVALGVCALVWLPVLWVPTAILPPVSVLAASSLFVYLTHWQVYPHLEADHPVLATLASFAVGMLVWRAYVRASARTAAALHRVRGVERTPLP